MSDEKPGYWATIPASVRYSKDVCSSAKLLFAEITSLQNATGTCWAGNAYFANLYEVSLATISVWISQLRSAGFIIVDANQAAGNKRQITTPDAHGVFGKSRGGIPENRKTSLEKSNDPSLEKSNPHNKKRGNRNNEQETLRSEGMEDHLFGQGEIKSINNLPPESEPEKSAGATLAGKVLLKGQWEISVSDKGTLHRIDIPTNLRTPEFMDAWTHWRDARKEIGHPLKPTGVKLQLREMSEWGAERAIAAMMNSAKNGWQKLVEPRPTLHQTLYGKPMPATPETVNDIYGNPHTLFSKWISEAGNEIMVKQRGPNKELYCCIMKWNGKEDAEFEAYRQ